LETDEMLQYEKCHLHLYQAHAIFGTRVLRDDTINGAVSGLISGRTPSLDYSSNDVFDVRIGQTDQPLVETRGTSADDKNLRSAHVLGTKIGRQRGLPCLSEDLLKKSVVESDRHVECCR
jgi:hypothetical protein